MNVFFDVQGTLISDSRPRPHVRAVFLELSRMGHHIYLWSSAGDAFAANAARFLEVEDVIFGCYPKTSAVPITVDFVVDDYKEFAARHGGYAISPFDGDPEDDELWRVVEVLRRQA